MTMADRMLSTAQRVALNTTISRLTTRPVDPPPPVHTAAVDDIVRRVVAKPWWRTAVDAPTLEDITSKIRDAVSRDRPVEFAIPFGGYKGWRLASFPHLDWAEVFWLDYLRRYAERIVAIHRPGVVISFTHTSGVLKWANNMPEAAQAIYMSEFRKLLGLASSPRLRLEAIDHADAYGGGDAVLEIVKARVEHMPQPDAAALDSARRNLVPPGAHEPRSWDDMTVEMAARRCAAMNSLELRRDFNKYGPRIQITHIRGASLSVHLGSCSSAITQPWVANGHLSWDPLEERWIERLVGNSSGGPRSCGVNVEHRLIDVSRYLANLGLQIDEHRAEQPVCRGF